MIWARGRPPSRQRAREPHKFAAVVYVIPLETELLKDTERWRVPCTDSRPEPFAPCRYRGIEHRASRLSGVAAPMRTLEQLIRDLRLLNGGAADDQPAIADEVAFVTAPDGQQGDPRCRRCRELPRDVFPGALNRRRPVTAFGVKDAELIGVRLGPWLQSQPLGLKVDWHRLVRMHGPSLHPGPSSCFLVLGCLSLVVALLGPVLVAAAPGRPVQPVPGAGRGLDDQAGEESTI